MWPTPGGGTVGATMSTFAAALPNRPARAPAWREPGSTSSSRRLEAAGVDGAFRVQAELPLGAGRA
jgi:hypothetical protein